MEEAIRMSTKEQLIEEIEALPSQIVEEVYDFISFLKIKKNKDNNLCDISLASEKSLAMDWLLPEEDIAWANL